LQKPICDIPFGFIDKVERVDTSKLKFNYSKELHYFTISLVKRNEDNISEIKLDKEELAFLEKNGETIVYSKSRDCGRNVFSSKYIYNERPKNPIKNFKIDLIAKGNNKNLEKVLQIKNAKQKENSNYESYLLFASKDENLINKWVYIIDYLSRN